MYMTSVNRPKNMKNYGSVRRVFTLIYTQLYRRWRGQNKTSTCTSVFEVTTVYSHMPILRPHAARYSTNVASLSDETASARATQILPILGFWGSKVPKNGRFPALDADEPPCKIWRRYSFIVGGKIRNRTNTHTHTHTHTHNKKTVTDISTPCLSACVDNKTMKR